MSKWRWRCQFVSVLISMCACLSHCLCVCVCVQGKNVEIALKRYSKMYRCFQFDSILCPLRRSSQFIWLGVMTMLLSFLFVFILCCSHSFRLLVTYFSSDIDKNRHRTMSQFKKERIERNKKKIRNLRTCALLTMPKSQQKRKKKLICHLDFLWTKKRQVKFVAENIIDDDVNGRKTLTEMKTFLKKIWCFSYSFFF